MLIDIKREDVLAWAKSAPYTTKLDTHSARMAEVYPLHASNLDDDEKMKFFEVKQLPNKILQLINEEHEMEIRMEGYVGQVMTPPKPKVITRARHPEQLTQSIRLLGGRSTHFASSIHAIERIVSNINSHDIGRPVWIHSNTLSAESILTAAPVLTMVERNHLHSPSVPIPSTLPGAAIMEQAVKMRRFLYTEDNDVIVTRAIYDDHTESYNTSPALACDIRKGDLVQIAFGIRVVPKALVAGPFHSNRTDSDMVLQFHLTRITILDDALTTTLDTVANAEPVEPVVKRRRVADGETIGRSSAMQL